jgi:hypothetical protein
MEQEISNRRGFLGITGAAMAFGNQGVARPLTEKEKLARIASNTWPVRMLFKSRGAGRRAGS